MESQLLQCPFNKSHQILKHRMSIHLVKCGRGQKSDELVVCPFNVTHFIKKMEIVAHVSVCESRKTMENFRNVEEPSSSQCTQPPPMPVHQSEENWDDDNAPTYNPTEYVSNAPVLRYVIGAKPSERKMFRKNERLRLLGMEDKS